MSEWTISNKLVTHSEHLGNGALVNLFNAHTSQLISSDNLVKFNPRILPFLQDFNESLKFKCPILACHFITSENLFFELSMDSLAKDVILTLESLIIK